MVTVVGIDVTHVGPGGPNVCASVYGPMDDEPVCGRVAVYVYGACAHAMSNAPAPDDEPLDVAVPGVYVSESGVDVSTAVDVGPVRVSSVVTFGAETYSLM